MAICVICGKPISTYNPVKRLEQIERKWSVHWSCLDYEVDRHTSDPFIQQRLEQKQAAEHARDR